jgi:hypothetical protein
VAPHSPTTNSFVVKIVSVIFLVYLHGTGGGVVEDPAYSIVWAYILQIAVSVL